MRLIDNENPLVEGGHCINTNTGELGVILVIVGRVADVRWEDGRETATVIEGLAAAK